MLDEPLISIGICAYNAEGSLRGSIESVLGQSYGNIELIVVDDASADSTSDIANGYQAQDARVKVVLHGENRQLFEARRTCVENADGEYFMFLDADDCLAEDACERCVRALEENPVDILQFTSVPVYRHEVSQETRLADASYLTPEAGSAVGEDVVHRTYIDRKGPWCMWAKLFSTSILKEAYANMPGQRLFMAEDTYSFFVTCHYAWSFRADPSIVGHYYRIDAGETGEGKAEEGSIQGLEKLCAAKDALDAIGGFIERQDAWSLYRRDHDLLKRQFVDDCVGYLVTRMPEEAQREAFDRLLDFWSAEDGLEAYLRRGFGAASECLGLMRESKAAARVDATRDRVCFLIAEEDRHAGDLLEIVGRFPGDAFPLIAVNAGGRRLYRGENHEVIVAAEEYYEARMRNLAAYIERERIGVICLPDLGAYPYCWDSVVASLKGCLVVSSHQVLHGQLPQNVAESAQPAAKALAGVCA